MTRKDYIKLARLLGDMLRSDQITSKGVGRIVSHLAVEDKSFKKEAFWFELEQTLNPPKEVQTVLPSYSYGPGRKHYRD